MRRKPFWKIFVSRFAMALILIFLTYNTFGYSYVDWAFRTTFEGMASPIGAGKILTGITLAVLYMILLWSTWRAKGPLGIGIMLVVLGTIVYFGWALGLIDFSNATVTTYVVEAVAAIALAVGSTWSIFWRRFTGQVAVEDPDTIGDEA